MSSIDLKTTPQIMSFYQEYSPNVNGAVHFTNTNIITPYFLDCFNGFIDPIVNKFNKNGTSILQSCVLDASCQKANGCSAICGKIPGDSQVVTFKSDLDWNQNRRLRITAYNVLNPEVEVDLEVIKYGNGLQMSCDKYSNGVRMSCGGQTCFKSDFTKLDGLALLGISFALAVICGRCLNTRP